MKIRPVTNLDCQQVIALIDSVYGEYGDTVNLGGAESDLLDLESAYEIKGADFVVLENEGTVVGSHAVVPIDLEKGLCTFRRLYLLPEFRGTKCGYDLMQWAIDRAAQREFKRVEFWSDTRFARAHKFFEKFGFSSTGEVRDMDDGHEPYSEFFFYLNLPSQ